MSPRPGTRFLPYAHLAIVFDLDDTLLKCQMFYTEANRRLAALLASARPDLTAEQIIARFRAIDGEAMRGPMAYRVDRYPASMVETCRILLAEGGQPVTAAMLEAARAIGAGVFEAPYPLLDGVEAMLATLQRGGARLGICTKGDPGVQHRKLARHDLYRRCDVVSIVPEKTPDVWAAACALTRGPHTTRTLVVGNSLRDDIGPGQVAGAETVWVAAGFDHTWIYEQAHDGPTPTHTIQHPHELLGVLAPVLAQRARTG